MQTTITLPALLSFGDFDPATKCTALVPGRGEAGWAVYRFPTVEAREAWALRHQASAMPCWKRLFSWA